MTNKEVIQQLRERAERLMQEHARLSDLNRALVAERDTLRGENRRLQLRVRDLEQEVSSLQLSDALGGGSVHRERARARVNRLMREVDRCIALLGRQDDAVREVRDAENRTNE